MKLDEEITCFCSSARSKVASAQMPPYVATLAVDMRSGMSQWSRFAERKCFAADLYFLVARSARPCAQFSLVRIVMLLS